MNDELAELQTLHYRILARKPMLAELPRKLRDVAMACHKDEADPVCRWGHENLSSGDWKCIREALAEDERRAAERVEAAALCRGKDEAGLRSMYPGHARYYDSVVSPPPFEERQMDAVVVIESGAGSLVRKATRILDSGMAREALKVQYGGTPNKYAGRFNTERFFMGYYTPEIEARMETPRPDCKRLRNSQYTQAACRRDITLSIVRDWLEARGHRSARFLMTYQASWPHFALLIQRLLGDFDTAIDPNFHTRMSRRTSFLQEVCAPQRGATLWIDYEAYVATLVQIATTAHTDSPS